MNRIIPALLTQSRQELGAMLSQCAQFTDFVQIDIMDGVFVPSLSVTKDDILAIKSPVGCEAHLMVENPLDWIDAFSHLGAKRIFFHYEIASRQHEEVVKAIRNKNMAVGLVVNPDTTIKEFSGLVDLFDCVLFMSVYPGFYGAKFLPKVLDKIREFKLAFPKTSSAIDGGVKMDNLKQIQSSGVDDICVGSALMKANNPSQAYQYLLGICHE